MKLCKYCNSIPAERSGFCSKEHKQKFEKNIKEGIDFVAPPITSRGYTDHEKKLIQEYQDRQKRRKISPMGTKGD